MKILLPHHSFEDSFADNVQDTLVSMGHDVRTLGTVPRQRYWGVAQRLWRASLPSWPHREPCDRSTERSYVWPSSSFLTSCSARRTPCTPKR